MPVSIPAIVFKNLHVNKLYANIEPHLFDPDLSVNKLTRLIGMSRTDLHRKLIVATGMSATEFIRFFRLKRAASLMIEQADLKISHVALKVGFYNLSYFIKSFRSMYGVTPHIYRKRILTPVETQSPAVISQMHQATAPPTFLHFN